MWEEIFFDDFLTLDTSRYFFYPTTWRDTQEQEISGTGGFYSASNNMSVGNGNLSIRLFTDSTGIPRVTAFIPTPPSLSARGDFLGMRTEIKIRADLMAGYKGVPLYWPMSGIWPRDGEINWPEGDFNRQPAAFMHRQDATESNDQDWYNSLPGTTWQDWHVYRVEWVPGVYVKFYQNGQLIGYSTSRIPNTPMHWVLQFETDLANTRPDPSVSGNVQIDYIKVWRYIP